ncbi:CmpA/NrtA family ABC transporter substrate-binding protein [Robbsia sp. Bb-Pol-6]|uniref:CmpA/NrtA family ABC transporter substrate-binding protein n=1 Tax=Robbsia betulipollinis TaxID=2981849 RepID=A0ABT3ZRP3_9BURK|nr:CmpA/NrtA family ABC transporter substrate-binding protein [Robbsia betulipollinis]MCY0389224.1 CmpA/NrtA family ABC transporter substrate-binding protein [Robbsia betulipollinis]
MTDLPDAPDSSNARAVPAVPAAHASGSDAPEKRVLRVGFVPLSDCAPLVLAVERGLDRRHGIEIELCRQPSWAAVRDKLLSGELDAAHALAGLPIGVELGIGGPRHPMAVLMTLNQNGQAITLSRALAARWTASGGVGEAGALARALHAGARPGPDGRPVFAHTFPTGTHAMWLYYWLAAQGIDPLRAIDSVVIPPQQMAASMGIGELDGFCAGEPWSAQAEAGGAGVTVATTDAVWPDHPEKVVATTRRFVDTHPHAARALVTALLDACRRLDAPAERRVAAELLARPGWIDAPYALIAGRLCGDYRHTAGGVTAGVAPPRWPALHVARPLRFFGDGAVNFPYVSDAVWFMTQYRRWGMLSVPCDYAAVAATLCRTALYREAAGRLGVATPARDARASVLMDGRRWDGSAPWDWDGSGAPA